MFNYMFNYKHIMFLHTSHMTDISKIADFVPFFLKGIEDFQNYFKM